MPRISALPSTEVVNDTDELAANQAGTTVRLTRFQLLDGHQHVLADIIDAGTFAARNSLAIEELDNVAITAPADNEVLSFDSASGNWINGIAPVDAVSLLGVPLDASVATPTDGSILVFRDLGSDWILEAKPAGASPNLNDLGDVTITAVVDNEVLAFNTATGEWVNQTPAEAGLSAVGHTHALGGLSDVTEDAPLNNEVLAFDTGTGVWTNQTAVEAGLQALLAAAGVTVRSAGTLSFDGGLTGQVWTVDASGNVSFTDASAHTHTLADITDVGNLAGLDTVGTAEIDLQAVTLDRIVDQAGITPGQFTNATVTVSQEGIVTAISSGAGGGGGLTTATDSGTAITVGAADGTHKILDAGTAITLTLSGTAAVGVRQAFTPGGAGAVTVAAGAGAGYWLPGDNTTGTARATSFGLTGYGYFECFRNTGGSAAEWAFVGESDHADLADNPIDFADVEVSRPEFKDYAETSPTPSSVTGTLTLDLETGNVFDSTLTEATTLAFANPPATGKAGTAFLIARQDATGGRTLAFPASVMWASGTAPTISSAANAIDVFTFVTRDAGTTWLGFVGGQAFS